MMLMWFFFFFQAEDGIRDATVTGVQTCALPISMPCFDRGIAIFGELGARWEMADARAARGMAYRNLGRLDQAEEDLRFAIRTAEELGDRQIPPWTWRNLARVAELRGDAAAAKECLRRSKDAESRG